jgi:hypothetical protein
MRLKALYLCERENGKANTRPMLIFLFDKGSTITFTQQAYPPGPAL